MPTPSEVGETAMTCIPIDMQIGRADLFSGARGQLADRRRRLSTTWKQARVVAIVFFLGAGFHMMKWAGMLVL
jgi:hypothetical protein